MTTSKGFVFHKEMNVYLQPLVIYFCLYYSLSNHDKIGKYFNSKIRTSTSFSVLFGSPVTFFLFNPAHRKKELLFVSVLRPFNGKLLDSFLLPFSSSNKWETWKRRG